MQIKDIFPKRFQDSICPAPFVSIQTNAFGSIGICPKSAGIFLMGTDTSIKEKWNSAELEAMRDKFLGGGKPKECFRCWEEEQAGMKSLRQTYLEQDAQDTSFCLENVNSRAYSQGPEKIVIQIGNYCNFSCRTCHAADSSGFNAEGEFYAKEYNETFNRYRNPTVSKSFAITDNRHFSEFQFEELKEMTHNLRRIEFFGGEPMLNKTHLQFLRDLIQTGNSNKISLMYSTNGSVGPNAEHLELWKEFKFVLISFSIDGSRENFNYIRYPGKWETLLDNVSKFKRANESFSAPKLFINASVTVSLLNIYNLPNIIDDIEGSITTDISLNLVLNPKFYAIQQLPVQIKPIICARLKDSKHSEMFQGVLNQIKENPTRLDYFEKFIIWTIRKDRYRKQDFKQMFPEYYELLRPWFLKFGTKENLTKMIEHGEY